MLGNDGFHLRIGLHDPAHLVDVAVARLERRRRRHFGADPEIPFFQMRQELETQARRRQDRDGHQQTRAAEGQDAIGQREFQHRVVKTPEPTHEEGVLFLHHARQDQGAQGGRHGKGGQKSAGDGVGIGLGHGTKDVPLHPYQGEQGNEAGDDDRCRKEDRPVHLRRRLANCGQLARQAIARTARRGERM